jgi:hypothetical protein
MINRCRKRSSELGGWYETIPPCRVFYERKGCKAGQIDTVLENQACLQAATR